MLPKFDPEKFQKAMETVIKIVEPLAELLEEFPPIEVVSNLTLKDRPNKEYIAVLIEKKPKEKPQEAKK